jgi:hypothetical protein
MAAAEEPLRDLSGDDSTPETGERQKDLPDFIVALGPEDGRYYWERRTSDDTAKSRSEAHERPEDAWRDALAEANADPDQPLIIRDEIEGWDPPEEP